MRPLPLLGLVAGVALLAWGGYALYGRFAGPEVYWGKEKVESLARMEDTLGEMRTIYAEEQEQLLDLRKRLAAMPDGEKKAELGKQVDGLASDTSLHDKGIQESDRALEASRTFRDEAKGRALRRGILFTLLGLIWSARAGWAVFKPARRPATAAPGPSPP